MDTVALVSSLMAAKIAEVQLAVAARLANSQPDSGSAVALLTQAADQNAGQLSTAAQSLGQNLDISV